MKLVWWVVGEDTAQQTFSVLPTLFDTKEGAEIYARELFPDENPSKRYARVMCSHVWGIAEVKGVGHGIQKIEMDGEGI